MNYLSVSYILCTSYKTRLSTDRIAHLKGSIFTRSVAFSSNSSLWCTDQAEAFKCFKHIQLSVTFFILRMCFLPLCLCLVCYLFLCVFKCVLNQASLASLIISLDPACDLELPPPHFHNNITIHKLVQLVVTSVQPVFYMWFQSGTNNRFLLVFQCRYKGRKQ